MKLIAIVLAVWALINVAIVALALVAARLRGDL